MMIVRYRCNPQNSNSNRQDEWKWLIDIGAVPTQTDMEMIGKWLIDIGAAPTSNWNWQDDEWLIDIGVALETQTQTDKMNENDQSI